MKYDYEETNDPRDDDGLNAARGIIFGTVGGLAIWVLVVWYVFS